MKSDKLKIFFSGIGGSGVSAIAGFMADKGHEVAGSDRAFDLSPAHPLKKAFQSAGISIVPQDGSGFDRTFDFVVFSTAVEPDRPEVMKAKELEIPVKTRPDYLAEITAAFRTVAVAGTSGKSTASGMLAFIMRRLGLGPNYISGGKVGQFKTESSAGNYMVGDSDYLIIEACESDGSIVQYKPEHTLILNLDLDHHSIRETEEMFQVLINRTGGKVIMNADDRNLSVITGKDAVTFSIHNPSDYKAEKIVGRTLSTDFTIGGTKFSLSLPGLYNVYNAISCIAMLSEMGVPLDDISKVLPEFEGIDRRFDVYLNDGEYLVIDDYAHNPHKISALMGTMKQLADKVCYIFQPHGFGPTRMMKKEYIETFVSNLRDTDHLILLPIFYAGGTAAQDISSNDLADGISRSGRSVRVMESREDLVNGVGEYQTYAVLGARDDSLSGLADKIARKIVSLSSNRNNIMNSD